MKRTDEQLQELLLRELSGAGKLRRKQLIEAGIAALGMEVGSDADLTPGAPLTMMKSRLGMVLTGLIHAGSIREDEAGFCIWNARRISSLPLRQSAHLSPGQSGSGG